MSIRTLLLRRKLRVAVGDAGNTQLLRAMRVHANFAEYVPFCLLLVAFCELQGTPASWLHAALTGLLVGRLSHAYGVSQVKEPSGLRVLGVALTLTVLFSSAIRLVLVFASGHGA
ncbi:MAG: MAPEG family protein [Rhizobacter sp.]|nr:MAPEG family protein [Rhizobacter sp.]